MYVWPPRQLASLVTHLPHMCCRYGRVVRPGLGVMAMNDSHSRQLLLGAAAFGGTQADAVRAAEVMGVVVGDVVPGSGAAQVGIR